MNKVWTYCRAALGALSALCLLACAGRAALPGAGEVRSAHLGPELSAFLDDAARMTAAAMARGRIPGLAIALTDENELLWEDGFGFADKDRKIAVTPATRFSIQSMSKVFTAVGVLTAARDGLLDLDAPVTRCLPGFTVGSIFEEHPEKKITLRHLLSHTAGFTHEAPVGNNADPEETSFDAHAASISRTWLMFPVGTRESYSNLGIDLAGYMLETVTCRPFADTMAERVFRPLDLTRTTMDVRVVRADPTRAVGRRFGFVNLPVFVPMTAAGGVWSTAHDMQSFVRFMLTEGRGRSLLPGSAFLALRTTPNGGGYGLGVAFGRFRDDLFLHHGGGGFGFSTWMAWYPTYGIGITVLTNSADHNGVHVELANALIGEMVDRGLVKRKFPLSFEPVNCITIGPDRDNSRFFEAHAEKMAWKDEWKHYLGDYRTSLDAELTWYARVALFLGYPRDTFIRISRAGSGMALDGAALLQQEPGLFFTAAGEALDFRGETTTWRNIKVHRR